MINSRKALIGSTAITGLITFLPVVFYANLIAMTMICRRCIGRTPLWQYQCRDVEGTPYGPLFSSLRSVDDVIIGNYSLYIFGLFLFCCLLLPFLVYCTWPDHPRRTRQSLLLVAFSFLLAVSIVPVAMSKTPFLWYFA